MSSPPKPALSALVAPRSLEEFAAHWPDKVFHADGDPARLPEFLRARELSSLGALATAYRGRVAFGRGAKSAAMVASDAMQAPNLFRMGLTVYFDDIGAVIPGAKAFLKQFEEDLGINEGSARLTAWASPSEDGAACHYDANDVISIQLRGTKRYEIAPVREIRMPYGRQYSPGTRPFEDLYPQTANGFPEWQDIRFQTIELQPGSVLFFPRGTWHRTQVSENSLAAAIVIDPPPAIDCLLAQLRLVLLQDPAWRKPLYGAWGNGAGRVQAYEQAARLLRELPKAAGVISPQDLILPTISEEKRLALVDRHTRFQRVPRTGLVPEQGGSAAENAETQWLCVTFDNDRGVQETLATIEVPRRYMAVLEWISRQNPPFSVQALSAQFPAVPFEELKQVLGVCARGGLVKLLWFPAIDGQTPDQDAPGPSGAR